STGYRGSLQLEGRGAVAHRSCGRGLLLRLGRAGPRRLPARQAGGVLGNQGACVIAKSYEMKAAGVQTGEPIWEAVKKCRAGVYRKRDFRWSEVLSRRMLDVLRCRSPRVEFYSIDEFFFDATDPAAALALRDEIRAALGLPVTVGVARTKMLAKLV